MKAALPTSFAGALVLIATLGLGASAQEILPPVPGQGTKAKAVAVAAEATESGSPVQYFRELLVLPKADQTKALASKPDWQRRILSEKLTEYQVLPATEREKRLQATELRWFLKKLAPLEGEERSDWLPRVPSELRPAVESRLAEWDQLSPGWRREVLDYERTMTWLHRQLASESDLSAPVGGMLAGWSALQPDQRKELAQDFLKFFDLRPEERRRVLEALPEDQRRAIIPTVERFAGLSDDDRATCLESLGRLAELPDEARARLLEKARQWRELTSEEQQTWRNIATKFPPLPPGLVPVPGRVRGIPYPPLPPGLDLPTMPPPMMVTVR